MLSQTAEYALCAVVHLGRHGSPCTAQQIARATGAPGGYLAKVLQALSKAGIVNSRRGLHGGFVLNAPPERISVYDVVQAVAPIKRNHDCSIEVTGRSQCCPLHRELDEAMAVVEAAFRNATIAMLVNDDETTPVCRQQPDEDSQ